ncbi:AAA family ATPase [Candidatus Falkowbacteria bacterium HGW-Falkowbacteria-1]|uniref:AAA family ATPase n=1 Tax=Candidatus Falkowbacteria bacterium HGW-Falkowbacteria-1 TaxID=2013768 RepID=A0A2N2EAA0_9BACT|nr:MAG: AAA family ATPase [Candidatus Falkowbacteria bacterium HGW-Falkowbacteria-1]
MNIPLAFQLRPQNLKEFFGQEKIVGPNTWLRSVIEKDQLASLVFWGPPGTGKTTLAFIISKEAKADFVSLSAVSSGIKDLKEIVIRAGENRRFNKKTILFIDEIHRWNKAQQDALLPHIENGLLVLIGATTENPSFSVNSSLLSRLKVLILESLSDNDLINIIKRAEKNTGLKMGQKERKLIASLSGGDARRALNIVESILESNETPNLKLIKELANKPQLHYDKDGEEHYNLISALHKSLRGSDAKAALYWIIRMLESGEDPLYVARRLIRFASEDIGLANNSALMIANQAYEACAKIGWPECSLSLVQATIYLAKSKKSIAVYKAYNLGMDEISQSGSLPVPIHLRNAPTKFMKDIGYGKDYKYTPEEDDTGQNYLPDGLKNQKFKKLVL